MNSTKPPAGRILKGPRAFYFVPDGPPKKPSKEMPWRRLTLKASKDTTPRTIGRNHRRINLAVLLGKPELLQAPA